jgi:hypothetical protein
MGAVFLYQQGIPIKGPASVNVAGEMLKRAYSDIRVGAWSPWTGLPDFLRAHRSIVDDLNASGVLRFQGSWAPTARGSFLWAVWAPGSSILKADSLIFYELRVDAQARSSTETGLPPGAPPGATTGGNYVVPRTSSSSSTGLPPGAPPANQAHDPLARLRALKKRKGIR